MFKHYEHINCQAQAVLCYLGDMTIENSWDHERGEYAASPKLGEWHNCRETGYVVSLKSHDYKRQLNIAFFEHRNTDAISAVKWEQLTINPPTIDTAEFPPGIYENKYDYSHDVSYGRPAEMARWIAEQFQQFWKETGGEPDDELPDDPTL